MVTSALPELGSFLYFPVRRVREFIVGALDKFKWEPTLDRYGTWYYITKDEFNLRYCDTYGVDEEYLRCLMDIGQRAIETLKEAANDVHLDTREAAFNALNLFGTSEVSE